MDTQRIPGKRLTAQTVPISKSNYLFPLISETVHSSNLDYNKIKFYSVTLNKKIMRKTFNHLHQIFAVILCLHSFGGALFAIDNPQPSISSILNPDGTVKTGMNGSYNTQGFSMEYTSTGAPKFVSAENPLFSTSWDTQFYPPGTNDQVWALAVIGANLYVGGLFTTVGGVSANYIAKYDGSNWSALGSGMNGSVCAFAVSGSYLYAGGYFTTAVGVSYTNYIAKWSTTSSSWSSLGEGKDMNSYVLALAVSVSGSDLYAGGSFTSAGGVAVNRIAKYDGSNWSALGSGMTGGYVYALAVINADLYAGGSFTSAGGVTDTKYIAKWNGSWSPLGSGMSSYVFALAVINNTDLYAGGMFTSAGGVSANYIAKWNGSWSPLGTGMNSEVNALAVMTIEGTDYLYAGGIFSTAGGVLDTKYIAKWDGSNWSALGTGMNNSVKALAVMTIGGTDYLCAGGSFTTAGGVGAIRIAKWNSSWSALCPGNGMNGSVRAFAVIGADLYAGGDFTLAGQVSANYIAKWNGTTWSALGTGMNNSVWALAVSGEDLYAGGWFTTAGGVTVNRIAKWNSLTSSWSALGTGMDGYVYALTVSGSDLYAGGLFTIAGGVEANRIAKWNGSWSNLGTGMVGNSVLALAVIGTDLYAGGTFTSAGGVSNTNRIAKWSSGSWSALGTGMNNTVYALAVSGSDLYAGGTFTTAGGVSANRIAKWSSGSWSILGAGMSSAVYAISAIGANLYAGGNFTTAGGNTVNYISNWNGTSWLALGTGMNTIVNALSIIGEYLYAGGDFTTADINISYYIARWYDSTLPVELINFQHSITNNDVTLFWTTANEINNSGFDIERKINNNQWTKIGFVTGKGSTGVRHTYNYVDSHLESGNYKYRLKQIDYNGNYEYFQLNGEVVIGVPKKFTLNQNYPNPFNPVTKIDFELPVDSKVTLVVYDVTGREVSKLFNNEFRSAGYYTTEFNASKFASGAYFYRLTTDAFSETKRMLLIR